MILLDDNGNPVPTDKKLGHFAKDCVECGHNYFTRSNNSLYCIECKTIRAKQRLACKFLFGRNKRKKITPEYVEGEGIITKGLPYKQLLRSKKISIKPIPKHMRDFNKKADALIRRLDNMV